MCEQANMKFLGVIYFLFLSMTLNSQEIKVKSFEETPNDLIARTQEKLDANGNACAVVRVGIPLEDVVFKGWVIETISTPGEYIVYMPAGASKITIQHKSIVPFVYNFETPIESKHTYKLIIEIKKDSSKKREYKVVDVSEEIKQLYTDGISLQEKGLDSEALKLFTKAAEAGYAPAQNKVGGSFLATAPNKSIMWYKKAAVQGYPNSILNLGIRYLLGHGVDKDVERAVQYFEEASELDYPDAYLFLGNSYWAGEGIAQDKGKAVWCYRKAADKGLADAQYYLGTSYFNGEGVAQDYKMAVYWYEKAAEQGHANAQNGLGNCFNDGKGTEQDYSKAVFWYRKAAEQGDEIAQYNLGNRYKLGQGIKQDYSKAKYWYEKAAKKGDADAQVSLSILYYDGKGVVKDVKKAKYWCKKAADQGHSEAKQLLSLW